MTGKCNLVSVLGLLLVLTMFYKPIAGQRNQPIALFLFGDSNYDVGNKQILVGDKLVAQSYWPYGKSRDDPNGKFSDGLIAPDFLATMMGIPNVIPPALNPNANVSRGASFAVEDATVLGAPVKSMSLNQQIRKFNQLKAANWNDEYIKKSLFMIYIGANDYLNFTKNNPDADASAQQAFVTSVTNKLKSDISLLYNSGATKFLIQTIAPLGCLPIVRQDYNTGLDQCHEKLNDLAKQHNEKIGPMMNEFAKNTPGFQFTIFDFYNAILRRTQRGSNYRFSETNVSCCGIGSHNAYGCGLSTVHVKLCEYQRSYLFFDGRHNTEKAQESFAHLLLGADTNVINPMNVRELVVYPVDEPMRELWSPQTPASVQAKDSTTHGYESY